MKLLATHTAFSMGSSIWFTPDLRVSSWTRELDWYLGFQIFHAQSFQAKQIPETLQKILRENELGEESYHPPTDPTLALAVDQNLPTENVVVVSVPEPSDWLETCKKIWEKAQKPSVRLFLPASLTPYQVEEFWGPFDELSVVLNR